MRLFQLSPETHHVSLFQNLHYSRSGELQTREVYRFPNGDTEQDGHLVWGIDALEQHVINGIQTAKKSFSHIDSLSIDTRGCDYVLLQGDEPIRPCYAYRDHRTEQVVDSVHRMIPFAELYNHTGCQFQPFNTIYSVCS